MPSKPDKQHRIRVRTLDGRPRDVKELNKLKSNQLGMPHLDIVGTGVANELIICAGKDTHIEQVRSKLGGAGLEEIVGSDTTISKAFPSKTANTHSKWPNGFQQTGRLSQSGGGQQRLFDRHHPGRSGPTWHLATGGH